MAWQCHGMTPPLHTIPLSSPFHRAPRCPPPSSHSPERARHLSRRRRSVHEPKRNAPRRARTRQGVHDRVTGAHQSVTSPRSPTPPLALSACQSHNHVPLYLPDITKWTPEHCRRRHERRPSATDCQLLSLAPSHQTAVCCSKRIMMTAMTPGTAPPPYLAPSPLQTPSPWTT